MKILVTGATGFIGLNLVEELISQGINAHALIRKSSDTTRLNKSVKKHIYEGDIHSLISLFEGEGFDGVVHLASLVLSSHRPENIPGLVSSNLEYGTQLLEASKLSRVKWFLNTGTIWQNYHGKLYNPVNLYSATKEAFEKIASFYVQTSEVVFVTIKLGDTYGPNDTREKLIKLWCKLLKNGEFLDMSPGEQVINLSYIDDIVSAFNVMIDNLCQEDRKKYNSKVYTVSNKENVTLKELSQIFEKLAQTKLNINWGARKYREREVMFPSFSSETVPNWEQRFSIEEGIKNTIKEIYNEEG